MAVPHCIVLMPSSSVSATKGSLEGNVQTGASQGLQPNRFGRSCKKRSPVYMRGVSEIGGFYDHKKKRDHATAN